VCGGQRGRAYGVTGDYMQTDPACAYEPKGLH
jgi:MoaA/NifB/PqqE/SkfB family radical SAM enzyme